MNYIVEYKRLMDIIGLYENDISKTKKEPTLVNKCVEDFSGHFDLFLVNKNNKIINIFCADKNTLNIILSNNKFIFKDHILTRLFRCVIINYYDIIKVLEYNEFCERYKYMI